MSKSAVDSKVNIKSVTIIITGIVQGVGFRPFVYRLARQLNIHGYVENNAGQVSIKAEADESTLDVFYQQLIDKAPAISKPQLKSVTESAFENFSDFVINTGHELETAEIHIPPDLNVCSDCQAELSDPANRRYHYPFINCTQCGPRFSVIRTLPYDRKNTSMDSFKLCHRCYREYHNPADRRFHAEPTACDVCGPVLFFVEGKKNIQGNNEALLATVAAIKAGKIIAVKSTGGYHLMCDATNDQAVRTLRERKQRPDKPFALLMPEALLDKYVVADKQQQEVLFSAARPIVLVKKKVSTDLSAAIVKSLGRLGIMLPSNPLQILLCKDINKPLVATSANLSGEPVITDNDDATKRLNNIADAFLHHNRDIVRPADDSVVIVENNQQQLVRAGRGFAPIEIQLGFKLERPLLAVGGHIKNTVALGWDNRLVISAHNGDLGSLRGYQQFQQCIEDLQALYRVKAEKIICDRHPDYASSRWANSSGLPLHTVQHHKAHASSLFTQHPVDQACLVFSWDGVGLGDDNTLWGGETFYGTPGHWQRVLSFNPFKLPGADKTAIEAWRIAASLCWHTGNTYATNNPAVKQLKTIWEKNINSPESSAAGRLFSAAASLTGLVEIESWEGHGPSLLQASAEQVENKSPPLTLPVVKDQQGLNRLDWSALVEMLQDDAVAVAERAFCFHESLAFSVAEFVRQFNIKNTVSIVGLSGGVFQNSLLVERIRFYLDQQKINLLLPDNIPLNDAGISVGQIVESFYQ